MAADDGPDVLRSKPVFAGPSAPCILCNESLANGKPAVTLRNKGSQGINNASKERGDAIITTPGDSVHQAILLLQSSTQKESITRKSPILRSDSTEFKFAEHCLFCGQEAKKSGKKRGNDVFPVRTDDFKKTIEEACEERGDFWASEVHGRIEFAQDLHAADTIYHQTCSVNFRTRKQIPQAFSPHSDKKRVVRGRPNNSQQAFDKVVDYLQENSDKQITVLKLVDHMQELCGEDAFSSVYMKKKLEEHFNDEIVITEKHGIPNVVTFRSTATSILHKFYQRPALQDSESEKMAIISTAAKLLKNDIQSMDTSKESYPIASDLASLAKNIDYRYRSLSPVLRLPKGPIFLAVPGTGFLQFVADNVDHNIRTLDGFNTFHGMGIIAGTTPGTKDSSPIPRRNISAEELIKCGKIDVQFYRPPSNKMATLEFGQLKDVRTMDSTWKLDLLCKVVWPLKTPMPGWSGMMQLVQKGEYPGQSTVTFFPMIDMDPSDLSCIYSTLSFISTFDQPLYWKALSIVMNEPTGSTIGSIVLRLGGFHTIMSFLGSIGHLMRGSGLQELIETVYAPNAVSHMMTGKAVTRAVRAHMLVDTALYALLVSRTFGVELPCDEDGSVNSDALDETTDEAIISDECLEPTDFTDHYCATVSSAADAPSDMMTKASALYDNLVSGKIAVDSICENATMDKLHEEIVAEKKSIAHLRTASLWIRYSEMVDIIRLFIKSERTGNWDLYLQSMQAMLPYFAAAGHNLYAKSAYIYINMMQNLEQTHPDLYEYFQSGYHVLRRSDRYWAGLSTDLVIAQVLMRSVKTSGGMTRGRGMAEAQRSQWLLSMPARADFNNAMQELTTVGFYTSEQHKESTKSRKEKDHKDTLTILSFLNDRNPFGEDQSLRNIETGVTATSGVNVDKAKEIGLGIIESMAGQNVVEYSFKRSKQATTPSTKTSVKIDGHSVEVDPQLLFQHLTTVGNLLHEDHREMIRYELSTFPSALFGSSGLLREACKPALADAIWRLVGDSGLHELPSENIQHVLDGGSLLQRIPWSKGASFASICQVYIDYITRRYSDVVVVFDGYNEGPSTKDITHIRRTRGITSPKVNFAEDMPCKSKKETFLSNTENKQKFINLLSSKLLVYRENGCFAVRN